MEDNFRDDDLKKAWKQQHVEAPTMTIETMRARARELQAKTRRELWGSIGSAAIVVGIAGWGLALTHDPAMRLVFALAVAWVAAGQYVVHRGMWPATLPGDAALQTGLEFYRREVERRTHVFRQVLQWSFGPVALSLAALILVLTGIANSQGIPLQRIMPFCTLVIAWVAGVFLMRRRSRLELEREIRELRALERERE
jgi:hypothetical protein